MSLHLKGCTDNLNKNNTIAINQNEALMPAKKKRRLQRTTRVTFVEQNNSYHDSVLSGPKQQNNSELWYRSSELAEFKKQLVTVLMSYNSKDTIGNQEADDICGVRGRQMNMKHRFQCNRRTVRYIIKSQRMGGEFLGLIARHATRYAQIIAYGQGMQDYHASYNNVESSSTVFRNGGKSALPGNTSSRTT